MTSRSVVESLHAFAIFMTAGIIPLSIFYISGALSLVGTATQLFPMLPGLLVGGIVFSTFGYLMGRYRFGIYLCLAISAILFYLLFSGVSSNLILTGNMSLLYAVYCTSSCSIVACIAARFYGDTLFLKHRFLKVSLLGLLPTIIPLLYAEVYVSTGEAFFPLYIVGTWIVLLALSLLPFGNALKREERGEST